MTITPEELGELRREWVYAATLSKADGRREIIGCELEWDDERMAEDLAKRDAEVRKAAHVEAFENMEQALTATTMREDTPPEEVAMVRKVAEICGRHAVFVRDGKLAEQGGDLAERDARVRAEVLHRVAEHLHATNDLDDEEIGKVLKAGLAEQGGDGDALRAKNADLRARLAAAEAERDEAVADGLELRKLRNEVCVALSGPDSGGLRYVDMARRARDLRARLAAADALLDDIGDLDISQVKNDGAVLARIGEKLEAYSKAKGGHDAGYERVRGKVADLRARLKAADALAESLSLRGVYMTEQVEERLDAYRNAGGGSDAD